jgi:hypothetical protein
VHRGPWGIQGRLYRHDRAPWGAAPAPLQDALDSSLDDTRAELRRVLSTGSHAYNDYAPSSTTSLDGIRMKKRLYILGEAEGGLIARARSPVPQAKSEP